MTCRVRLVLAIHDHQPIGNFDGVFEEAYVNSYAPFLDLLQEYPSLPVSLHLSGSLLEWLLDAHPEYVERIRRLVEAGQVEILGGPYYEPILASIPSRDRIGQITAYSRHLERLFGAKVRGMWVPERVWEQSFASDIAEAGIEFTIVDDFHFKNAGLRDDQMYGYYLTEDEGRLIKIFPGSERLRYTIPFQEPQVSIDYLREIGERHPNAIVAFGDDGEKFGSWPGTKKHVYENGWLRRFFDALQANRDWLKVTSFGEAVDYVPPLGTCYLPDSSYREMTEWALPPERQLVYHRIMHGANSDAQFAELKPFIRGGFWRNFRVKYPEANEMYARMMQVSNRLNEMSQTPCAHEHRDLINSARRELYRGQCNCPYWHGAFGGLYLPHLRNAIYQHLIAADNLLDTAAGKSGRWVAVDVDDFNLDARQELRIAGDRLIAYVAPSRGGHLYELDVRGTKVNLLATLNRRPEPYHETVREAASRQHSGNGAGVASIHDQVSFKQPDLDKKLIYDNWPRKSLVDHFLEPQLALDQFQHGGGETGDFLTGVYETRLRRSSGRVEARLTRQGQFGPHRVHLTKTIALDVSSGGRLEIVYELEQLPPGVPVHFGVEFNFAAMAAGASDRYYYDSRGVQRGQLETVQSIEKSDRIGLIDEWLGLDAALDVSRAADFWAFPIQTVSQSEGGFELVHQSCMVMPRWEFVAPHDGRWTVKIDLSIDTSAAQARQLREAAAAL
ncbi:MAG: alpha-amylase/4-alpha-glucanotransferase domain-containing protein [Planctomycetaceae bacterium]